MMRIDDDITVIRHLNSNRHRFPPKDASQVAEHIRLITHHTTWMLTSCKKKTGGSPIKPRSNLGDAQFIGIPPNRNNVGRQSKVSA